MIKKLQNIKIKIKTIRQLFDERDPSPFIERDIDDEASDYIFSYAQEIGVTKLGKLVILIESMSEEDMLIPVGEAINSYFGYRYNLARLKIKSLLSEGFTALLIAFFIMALSYFITYQYQHQSFFMTYMKDSLVILSWVAFWKPLDIFLYEWWPLLRNIKIFKKLSTIETSIYPIKK